MPPTTAGQEWNPDIPANMAHNASSGAAPRASSGATRDYDGGNFECGAGSPWEETLGKIDILYHWSRAPGLSKASTTFSLPPEAGIRLASTTKVVIQVVYDIQQRDDSGPSDLRSLSSKQFWQEFQPSDSSGVRLWLSNTLRPHDAVVLTAGSFDFDLPAFTKSSITHVCHLSEDAANVRSKLLANPDIFSSDTGNTSQWELNVVAVSTQTHETGTAASIEISRRVRSHDESSEKRIAMYSSEASGHWHLHDGPYFSTLEPLRLTLGDAIRTECSFTTLLPSSERDGIRAGYLFDEELCLSYLVVWPARALRSPQCISGRIDDVVPTPSET